MKGEYNSEMASVPKFDDIGEWSEVKLEILKKYAVAYSTILTAQSNPPLYHVYIDAFAGPGYHVSRRTREFVAGSPLNALLVRPPFRDHYLIDIDATKVESLRGLVGNRTDVHVYHGDCNRVLLDHVFPHVRYEDYRRGLCILDPYGLHLQWKVIETAGHSKSIDLFLNFPVADMNRNVLWRDPEAVKESEIERMNSYWGDDSWRKIAYATTTTLFGTPEKEANEVIAEAFRHRLKEVAGFGRVPAPLPMRNSKGAIVYYLFFASQKGTAEGIVEEIFDKYRRRGEK